MGVLPFDGNRPYTKRFDSIIHPLVETHTGLVYVDARKFYESQRAKIGVILEMIRHASLVVVEISEKNPNVFLELGFAIACGKRLIVICEKSAWKKCWKGNPPFDLQGREVLIYSDDVDLKVRLGGFIAGALYRSQRVNMSWIPSSRHCHIQSATEFSLAPNAIVWSDRPVGFPFAVAYLVSMEETNPAPDIRLIIAPASQDYPRVVCIFPWEYSEIEQTRAECHIDYFTSDVVTEESRIQQIPVCQKSDFTLDKPWSVFLTFQQPNLVLESSFFESNIERLVVSMNDLLNRGFPLSGGFRLGFSANTKTLISEVSLREIYES